MLSNMGFPPSVSKAADYFFDTRVGGAMASVCSRAYSLFVRFAPVSTLGRALTGSVILIATGAISYSIYQQFFAPSKTTRSDQGDPNISTPVLNSGESREARNLRQELNGFFLDSFFKNVLDSAEKDSPLKKKLQEAHDAVITNKGVPLKDQVDKLQAVHDLISSNKELSRQLLLFQIQVKRILDFAAKVPELNRTK